MEYLNNLSLNAMWLHCYNNYSEFHLMVTFSLVSLFFGYAVCSVPYYIFDTYGFFSKYKIQPDRRPTAEDTRVAIKFLVLTFVFVITPMVIFAYPIFKFIGIHSTPELPSLLTMASQVAIFFIIEDFMNYWAHRALHTNWLYNNVHIVHHKHNAPFAMTASYAHPLEIIILGIPTFTGPVIFAPHIFTLWVWVFMRQFEAVHTHSGYNLPFGPEKFIPFFPGPEFHDYHHHFYTGNFASTFSYMDYIYGTDVQYYAWKAKQEAVKEKST
eukprot:GFYU01012688.1.p1 GENE.GFYU01012688.1~~GFYU01012688.1.p1  ORF type:complete len:269 (+),score=88.99 GFYU01012688.1:165-971(+)